MELFLSKILCYLCSFLMFINTNCFTLFNAYEVDEITPGADVRVVSFNVRCNSDSPFVKSIFYRSMLICSQLKKAQADTIGFQEVTEEWMPYLEKLLPEYDYIYLPRADDDKEASPLFYLKDKFNLLDSGTFWLSDTPDVYGSKYEFSGCVRICTWALLQNKETNESFVHMNTHLDHVSKEARIKQLEVLYSQAKKFEKNYPVIITGDFNDVPGSALHNNMIKSFSDCRITAKNSDASRTYHDYGNTSKILDFILVSKNSEALRFDTFEETINNAYLSDHNGVWADIKLK
ncbi:MAG: endonuclease/exonuclease/phosphatase family protein [Clostridia bacterium]|nr:endonuclease/exonuclease/phosphatase family protein [Clostridia bacterium]